MPILRPLNRRRLKAKADADPIITDITATEPAIKSEFLTQVR